MTDTQLTAADILASTEVKVWPTEEPLLDRSMSVLRSISRVTLPLVVFPIAFAGGGLLLVRFLGGSRD